MPPSPSAAALARASQDPPLSNGCEQVAAMDRQTDAIVALTNKIGEVSERFAPAADAVADLGAAQKKLCTFLIKHRLKLAASVPVVLIAVGGLSPNVAHVLAE